MRAEASSVPHKGVAAIYAAESRWVKSHFHFSSTQTVAANTPATRLAGKLLRQKVETQCHFIPPSVTQRFFLSNKKLPVKGIEYIPSPVHPKGEIDLCTERQRPWRRRRRLGGLLAATPRDDNIIGRHPHSLAWQTPCRAHSWPISHRSLCVFSPPPTHP